MFVSRIWKWKNRFS